MLALPTEDAAKLALRTQQIIAHETGVADVIDPLGGSYFLESLTDRMEALAEEEFARIDAMGKGSMPRDPRRDRAGALPAGDRGVGVPRAERFEEGDPVKVGAMWDFVESDELPIEILEIGPEVERAQVDRLRAIRDGRDGAAAKRALRRLIELAETDANLVEPLIDRARALCTEGEIVEALRGVFGPTPRRLGSNPVRGPVASRCRYPIAYLRACAPRARESPGPRPQAGLPARPATSLPTTARSRSSRPCPRSRTSSRTWGASS